MTRALSVRATFASLSVRNFRVYFIGQVVSISGTWMQRVAQSWFVLELTDSGVAVGLVTALQFLPILLLAPLGGVIADRFNRRRLILATQATASVIGFTLGVLVVTGAVELWMVYALAALLGLADSVDKPARQSFYLEMVDAQHLTNAVSLNAVMVNVARIFGPALAGLLIVTVGVGICFLVNGVSYLALILALLSMRDEDLRTLRRDPAASTGLREGFAYVRRTPTVLTPLLMMALVGMFTYEYQIVLPLFARFTFDGDAATFSTMTAAMGVGAVIGGLISASRRDRPATALSWMAALFGATQLLVAFSPTFPMALAGLVALGAISIGFLTLGNTTLQLGSEPEMRGRVMGLWAVAFVGSTPIGGPIAGWIGEQYGPRYALALGGVAALVAAVFGARSLSAVADETGPLIDGPSAKIGP